MVSVWSEKALKCIVEPVLSHEDNNDTFSYKLKDLFTLLVQQIRALKQTVMLPQGKNLFLTQIFTLLSSYLGRGEVGPESIKGLFKFIKRKQRKSLFYEGGLETLWS